MDNQNKILDLIWRITKGLLKQFWHKCFRITKENKTWDGGYISVRSLIYHQSAVYSNCVNCLAVVWILKMLPER